LPPKISGASSGSGVLEFSLRHATLSVFGREKDGKGFSHNFFLYVAKYLFCPRVPTEKAPFEVNSDYSMIGHTLHYQAEELVIKRFWRFLPLSLSLRGVVH
jgi:hypothetical protein